MPTPSHSTSRREFLLKVSAGAFAASTLPGLVHGYGESPNEKLQIAIIGAGGRGRANMGGVSGEKIVALCDTNPGVLATGKKQHPDAILTSDWRELVDRKDVDAVVVSTADHHHALASVTAMRNGKHVYSEKPLAHTVQEARTMQAEYIKRKDSIATQMGTQIHATDNYRRVVEMIQAGAVGPVREAHVWCGRSINPVKTAVLPQQPIPDGFNWDTWLGPAEMRPYHTDYWKGGNLNWNRRWEFGNGVLGDMGSHLIDLPLWALGLRQPLTISSEGPAADAIACPPWQVVTWEHPARKGSDVTNVPTKVVWYHGGEGMQKRVETLQPALGDATDLRKWFIGVCFVGDDGMLVADYGKMVYKPNDPQRQAPEISNPIPKSLGHHAEWLHGCKTGAPTLCNFDYSGMLIEHNLLGNVAHRAGEKLQWNGEAGLVEKSTTANALLTKSYRDGWTI